MNKHIAIVGGSSVDIFATSASPLISHDSNPGIVNIGFGGVGRNIAEILANLSQDVLLIAPFGQDPFSAYMFAHTKSIGVNTKYTLIVSENRSPYYISVNDSDGEMAVAISDLHICDFITPAFLSDILDVINACDAIIVDTNIPEESIHYLAVNGKPPLFADAVSTSKALKLIPSLPHLFAVKANRKEAEALLGKTITNDIASLKSAANRFHAFGVSHVFISLGKNGAFYSANGQSMLRKAYQTNVVNTNGCGDAFGAVAFLSVLEQKPPVLILQSALAAAAITAQSELAVASGLTNASIDTMLQESRNYI